MKQRPFYVIASIANYNKLTSLGYNHVSGKRKIGGFNFKYFSVVGKEFFNTDNPYGLRYDIVDKKFELTIFPKPRIVCLCGSTRHPELFKEAERTEALKGNIVVTVAMFGHTEGLDMLSEDKMKFDILHYRKIEIADEIFVLTKDKYIGESTNNEILYAKSLSKKIRYLEEME
jgi:hypothetical protein